MRTDRTVQEEAADWAVRTSDSAFDAWDEFTLWLASDPAHGPAYDAVTAAVADAAEALPAADPAPLPAANDDAFDYDMVAQSRFTRRWLGGAIAAAIVLAVTVTTWRSNASYTVETAPGETMIVQLDDGGTIELAGGSRIELDRGEPRFAQLERGEAVFTIIHDTNHPFVVEAGDHRLLDVGTVFNVNLRDDGLALAVSEGAVVFNPQAQDVTVSPGQALFSPAGTHEFELTEISPDQVGEWREGRLTFNQASLSLVAGELTRATGTQFTAAGDGEISGSIIFGPIAEDPRLLEDLLGVRIRQDGQGWVIEGL